MLIAAQIFNLFMSCQTPTLAHILFRFDIEVCPANDAALYQRRKTINFTDFDVLCFNKHVVLLLCTGACVFNQ
jgi:hypothetical protein